jgi:hypothetical protein
MKKIFTKEWAKATAIRAIKTVAQTAVFELSAEDLN